MGRNAFYVLLLSGVVSLPSQRDCDKGKAGDLQEGNLGQDGAFPWLGALRVHLHEGEILRIAVTGIVLIRDKYALANAHDVVRIPRDVFKDDSKAMFIVERNEPWTTPLEDYVAHPEYDTSTVNTIAIVELKIEFDEFNPVKAICWPNYSFNTSNHLYVIGYTDENQLLEKELHKMQFVKERHCDEFYSRAKLKDNKIHPLHVQCAFAEKLKKDCVWETGQVMASNATGTWIMVGLGVHGPGCAAPARFISVIRYLQWIEAVTDLDDISGYRRSAFGTGFKRRPKPVVNEEALDLPIHETFLRDGPSTPSGTILHPYQIQYEDIELYQIDRIDVDEININVFDDIYESKKDACKKLKTLLYNDETKIVTNRIYGSAVYKLTLHDMSVMGYSCIKVKVDSESSERAKLWWKKSIDKYEATIFEDMGNLPKKLIKILPVRPRMLPTTTPEGFRPGGHMEAMHVVDDRNYEEMENINLLLRFTFRYNATLKVTIYGPPYPPLGYTTGPPDTTSKAATTAEPKSTEATSKEATTTEVTTTEATTTEATTTELTTTEATTTEATTTEATTTEATTTEATTTEATTTEATTTEAITTEAITTEATTTEATTTEATTTEATTTEANTLEETTTESTRAEEHTTEDLEAENSSSIEKSSTPKSFRRLLFPTYILPEKDELDDQEVTPYLPEQRPVQSYSNFPFIPTGRPSLLENNRISSQRRPYSFRPFRPIRLEAPRSKSRQEKALLREAERRFLARKLGARWTNIHDLAYR